MNELPQPVIKIVNATYDAPHVVTSVNRLDMTIRQGGGRQVDFEVETSWSETKPGDVPFKITAKRSINFAGQRLEVLTDGFEKENGKVNPSVPTASQYLALVGTRVLFGINVGVDQKLSQEGRTIYKIGRSYLTLP